MKGFILGRYRARINAIFGEMGRCDPMSQCAKQAVALILMINQDLLHPVASSSDLHVKQSDIWHPENERARCGLSNAAFLKVIALFDGGNEKVLTLVTNQLAIATVTEALLHVQSNTFAQEQHLLCETIDVLEQLETMLESDYYVRSHNKTDVRARLLEHIGKGMTLLQETYHNTKKKKSFFFF